jgi:hypothetical protein
LSCKSAEKLIVDEIMLFICLGQSNAQVSERRDNPQTLKGCWSIEGKISQMKHFKLAAQIFQEFDEAVRRTTGPARSLSIPTDSEGFEPRERKGV